MDNPEVSRYGDLLQIESGAGKSLYLLTDFVSYSVTTIGLQSIEEEYNEESLVGRLIMHRGKGLPTAEYAFRGAAAVLVYDIIREYYGKEVEDVR